MVTRLHSGNSTAIVIFLAAVLVLVNARLYVPHPEGGHPAGLLPDCPGTMKNATISSKMLQYLQVIVQRLGPTGNIVRKPMPIMVAPKMLAKDKTLNFQNKKTVVYAVGFFDSSMFPPSLAIGNSYAKRGYNVFITETLTFFTHIYPKSVRLSRAIGRKLGYFLFKLTQQGLTAENLELIGISLGAHVVGYAAKHFYSLTGKKPSRITGLDPAGPCFRSLPSKYRLDSTDAERVDVIHTNIDGFGIAQPLGHVDFYANGGEFQPGDIPQLPCLVICSHIRAFFYWWQALEHPKKFIAIKCNSVEDARFANCYTSNETNYLGLETNFDRKGIFYLPTSNEFPYFKGKEGLKEENEIFTSVINRVNSDDLFIV